MAHDTTMDVSTELAYDRTRLAYEPTLMAWVRTGVSLISFGFTITNSSKSFTRRNPAPKPAA